VLKLQYEKWPLATRHERLKQNFLRRCSDCDRTRTLNSRLLYR
jgi:hypothetical protein